MYILYRSLMTAITYPILLGGISKKPSAAPRLATYHIISPAGSHAIAVYSRSIAVIYSQAECMVGNGAIRYMSTLR